MVKGDSGVPAPFARAPRELDVEYGDEDEAMAEEEDARSWSRSAVAFCRGQPCLTGLHRTRLVPACFVLSCCLRSVL